MAEWRYDEIYRGSSYIGYVMDGDRVVCEVEHVGERRTDEAVERLREELDEIVMLHNDDEMERVSVRIKHDAMIGVLLVSEAVKAAEVEEEAWGRASTTYSKRGRRNCGFRAQDAES